jgi:hypothetical protein
VLCCGCLQPSGTYSTPIWRAPANIDAAALAPPQALAGELQSRRGVFLLRAASLLATAGPAGVRYARAQRVPLIAAGCRCCCRGGASWHSLLLAALRGARPRAGLLLLHQHVYVCRATGTRDVACCKLHMMQGAEHTSHVAGKHSAYHPAGPLNSLSKYCIYAGWVAYR